MSPTPSKPAKHWSTETHSVRERFSLGVMLLAIVYASVLFASFTLCDAPWPVPVFFASLLLVVALAQLGLRHLDHPRTVSLLVGAIYVSGWALLIAVWEGDLVSVLAFFIIGSPLLLGFGALLGYIAGVIDGSLFLIHDAVRDSMQAKRIEQEALMAMNNQKPQESPFDD